MTHLSSFMICERVQAVMVDSRPVVQLIDPMAMLALPAFPWQYSFAASIGLYGADQACAYRFRVLAPDGGAVSEIGPLCLPDGFSQPVLQVNVDFRNVLFQEAGLYQVAVFEDARQVGQVCLPVALSEEKG